MENLGRLFQNRGSFQDRLVPDVGNKSGTSSKSQFKKVWDDPRHKTNTYLRKLLRVSCWREYMWALDLRSRKYGKMFLRICL